MYRIYATIRRLVARPRSTVRRGSKLDGNAGTAFGKLLFRIAVLPFACVMLSACERDSETKLRSELDNWFFLGDTVYFKSQMRCTGAVFRVAVASPRSSLSVQDDPARAKAAFQSSTVAAIQMEGRTPVEMTDAMLLSGTGVFGKQVLAAGALVGACFEDPELSGLFHDVLTRPGALLAYDRTTDGLIVVDPLGSRLYYIAGDVW